MCHVWFGNSCDFAFLELILFYVVMFNTYRLVHVSVFAYP